MNTGASPITGHSGVRNSIRLWSLVCAIFVTLLLVSPIVAQSGYVDPQDRFSIAVPGGWVDESTDEYGRFRNGDALLFVLAAPAEAMDSGIAKILGAVSLDTSLPSMQTSEIQETNGNWTQNIYASADGSINVVISRLEAENIFALIFHAPSMDAMQAAAARDMRPIVQSFTLAGQTNSFQNLINLSDRQAQALDAALIADLEQYVNTALASMGGSGAQVAIVQNGSLIYSGNFGTTAYGGDVPVTSETRFMLGSVTKAMSGTLVATLVDDGLVSWDAPIVDLVPAFALADSDGGVEITLRHLLSHSSGIKLNRGWQSLLMYSPTQLLEIIAETSLQFQPGESALYNDTGFTVGVYGAITGAGYTYDETIFDGYQDLMQTRLFTPLGMTKTTVDMETVLAEGNYALPHTLDYSNAELLIQALDYERMVYPTAPASAIWSTAEDVARYLQMQLERGSLPDGSSLVSETTLNETWTAQVASGFGLDWFVGDYYGQREIHHNGLTLGYAALLSFLPDADLGVIVLTNRNVPDNFNIAVKKYVYELAFGVEHRGEVEARIAEEQYRARTSAAWQLVRPVDADLAEPYLGTYTKGIQVQYEDSALVIKSDYGDLPLTAFPAMGEGVFVMTGALGNFEIVAQFVPDANGDMTLTLNSGLYGLPLMLVRDA